MFFLSKEHRHKFVCVIVIPANTTKHEDSHKSFWFVSNIAFEILCSIVTLIHRKSCAYAIIISNGVYNCSSKYVVTYKWPVPWIFISLWYLKVCFSIMFLNYHYFWILVLRNNDICALVSNTVFKKKKKHVCFSFSQLRVGWVPCITK